ncbi:MAG: alpha/beta hydrolase [Blastocatellia bacterium]|nr:alpha/beta hydrolase [Blastocatellia bacterium]
MPLIAFGQDKFFDSSGIRIRYIEQGTGEPIVLLHGYAGDLSTWTRFGIFQDLAKDYRVIAIDIRGHGKSDKPHDPKQYGAKMGIDVIHLLDHLHIRKAHIVGLSMGGAITAKLLTQKPERFLTATLAESGGTLGWTAEDQSRAEREATETEQGVSRTVVLRYWPTSKPKPTEEEIEAELKERRAANAGQDVIARAAVRRSAGDRAVTEAQVAAVKVPTISIVGTADPVMEKVRLLKSVMPQLKVVTIDGATHGDETAAFRRPEFLRALREFLSSNSQLKR